MKISVLGATGRMGGYVIEAALKEGHVVQNKVSGRDSISNLFLNTECIIDFSCPTATESMLKCAIEKEESIPIVIGTTGLSKIHFDLMTRYAGSARIFYAPNMSIIVSIMNMMVYTLAKLLGEDFDAEILDIHHKFKKDAPSGTAIMLGKTIADARKRDFSVVARFVRHGTIGERQRGEIGFAVQRRGNIIGIHEVNFSGEHEDIKITHHAYSKEIFADGAVKAACWICRQHPGIYDMNDFTKDLIIPVAKDLYKKFFTRKI